MIAKEFTEQEIQGFKQASAKDHDGRAVRVDIDEPVCCTFVVAPYNRAEFAAHADARRRDQQTANVGAFVNHTLWPTIGEAEELRQMWATLPEKIALALLVEAGDSGDVPIVRRIDGAEIIERVTGRKTDSKSILLPLGLDLAKAAELIKGNDCARLWSIEVPAHKLSLVMRAPVSDTWLAAKAADGDARARCEGIIDATEPYVLGAVIWQNTPLIGGSGILDRKPALYWDLLAAYWQMGGYGATVRRKSL